MNIRDEQIEEERTYDLIRMSERIKELEDLINNPCITEFIEGVKIEQAHQTERWGANAENDKSPAYYSVVLDKLKGKQAVSIFDCDKDKYKHHLITMAAVCYNAFRQLDTENSAMNKFFKT